MSGGGVVGDYKSLRVKVNPSDLPLDARRQLMIDNTLDAYETFLLHQIIGAKLMDENADKWLKLLAKLNQVREDIKNIFEDEVK